MGRLLNTQIIPYYPYLSLSLYGKKNITVGKTAVVSPHVYAFGIETGNEASLTRWTPI